jgi:DNA sulfur modification protein DndB
LSKDRAIDQDAAPLSPLLHDEAERKAMYSRRRDKYVHLSVHPADVTGYVNDGWEIEREGKTKTRLRREKAHDVALEDQTWCLFYRMGYPVLNGTRFKIRYKRKDGSEGEKQIDAFAKDDETVIVAECKSKESRGRRSLQKDLHETEALQKAFVRAVHTQFGREFRPKFIWLYVTRNIIWSEPDVERAGAINVRIVTEGEMIYFDSFIRHMGPAGRYQFLAEFLGGQPIPGLANRKVPATRGMLGGRTFYSFVSTPRHLLKIAYVNHQALNHPDGRPAYQRMVAPNRIKEIQGFLQGGGFFPTNILINFTDACRFDLVSNKENTDPHIKFGWLYLPDKYKSAWIIDGQHRLYGYSHLTGKFLDQPMAVIAFERMPVVEEANLFVTINQKQKSVQPSVIVSLQAELKLDSADAKERLTALASSLVKQLNTEPTSPLAQRFSMQGVIADDTQSLTIPEMVHGLIRSGLLGRIFQKNHIPGPLTGATDQETLRRAKRFLSAYFTNLREANTRRWDGARDHYISTNPGVRAHLLLIAEALRYLEARMGIDPAVVPEDDLIKKVKSIVEPALSFITNASDEDVREKFSRMFGEGGVKTYFENLCELICKVNQEFGSDELRKSLALKTDQRIAAANQDVISLGTAILDKVFIKLKEIHGTHELKSGHKAYWEIGVESQKAKTEAYKKQVEDKREKQSMEAYLTLLELRDIIRQKSNWPHLEKFFSIPMPGEKGKTYYLDWMERFNEIRRIPSHPSGGRTYTEEDYEFIKFIKSELSRRLANGD